MKPVVFDLDDFCIGKLVDQNRESSDALDKLRWLKEIIPTLKVSLFTIPALSDKHQLSHIAQTCKWIELIPHGYTHDTSRECERWTYSQMTSLLRKLRAEKWPMVHGFKAPGWQISDPCYMALQDAGYWIADQVYNRGRRPSGISYYELDQEDVESVHGHIGHLGGHNANALELIEPQIKKLVGRQFKFVSEVVSPWRPLIS